MDARKFMKLSLLVDNPDSWFWKYVPHVEAILKRFASSVAIYRKASEIRTGDILFILSCDRILMNDTLSKNRQNIVIHASDLPEGKGWSPLTWQIEEGRNIIPLTLFEATEQLDSGAWYIKDTVCLSGYDLIDETREKLALKLMEMIEAFLLGYPLEPRPQQGEETFFPRRTKKDNELDINLPLAAQFNKLRVMDNERYPAYFVIDGHRFIIKIYKDSEHKND
ncbi:MAG: formyltransferase family protein [Nitrospirota bacterium]